MARLKFLCLYVICYNIYSDFPNISLVIYERVMKDQLLKRSAVMEYFTNCRWNKLTYCLLSALRHNLVIAVEAIGKLTRINKCNHTYYTVTDYQGCLEAYTKYSCWITSTKVLQLKERRACRFDYVDADDNSRLYQRFPFFLK